MSSAGERDGRTKEYLITEARPAKVADCPMFMPSIQLSHHSDPDFICDPAHLNYCAPYIAIETPSHSTSQSCRQVRELVRTQFTTRSRRRSPPPRRTTTTSHSSRSR